VAVLSKFRLTDLLQLAGLRSSILGQEKDYDRGRNGIGNWHGYPDSGSCQKLAEYKSEDQYNILAEAG
jgi:hypothetical protein